jgi:GNAT superfamily N-acetyltransferase
MVAQELEVAALSPAAAGEAIELFDRTFIFSRGRSISFAERFRDVFESDDALVVTGRAAGQIAAALVLRFFVWIGNGREERGAMIGLVCTNPPFHGRGFAAELLGTAEQYCRAHGCGFAVLWAARHDLYARLGWAASDNGTLGVRVLRPAAIVPEPLVADQKSARARIQALDEGRATPRVRRNSASYERLLPPADRLLYFVEGNSYAICGRLGATGYLYDIAAHDEDLARLWAALAGSFGLLHVNVEDGGGVHRWLLAQPGFTWTRQSLAMWKSFVPGAAEPRRGYIPFLDRI